MPVITYRQALNDALAEELERDENVVVMGEEVAEYNGAYKITEGLWKRFGGKRVIDTPISEAGFIGLGVGAAMMGMRPVMELMFWSFAYVAYDQIINNAGCVRYMSGGLINCPLVIRGPANGGTNVGATHSHTPENFLANTPGLKVVSPATPYDAKGLLIAAIEDNDPVIFFEPKRIYNGPFNDFYDRPVEPWAKHAGSEVPEGYYSIPLGKARIVREGEAMTVLAYGTMVHVVTAVLAEKGVDAEIIDLRTLVPLDIAAVERSVQKTGKCMIVHEATRTSGFGAELAALVQERCFYHLEAPIERVTGFDTPYPHSLEWAYFPGPVRIGEAVDRLLPKNL